MLRVHLWKEWREQQFMVLATCALLLLVPAGLAWMLPLSGAARLPWFATAVFVGAIAFGTELIAGDARRGQQDYLARLPGGIRSSYLAKVAVLLVGVVALGSVGWGAEVIAELIRLNRLWMVWRIEFFWLLVCALALATWLFAASCWRPSGLSALAAVLLPPAVLLSPLAWFAAGRSGIDPIALDLQHTAIYGIAAGLVMAWFGFRRFLGLPRERRRVRTCLLACVVAFVPLWAQGGWNLWRWHRVDPTAEEVTLYSVAVGSDARYAYLNAAQELIRGQQAFYAIQVDLSDGSWRQVGPPQSTWMSAAAIDRGISYWAKGVTPLLVRAECTNDGQVAKEVQFLIDTGTGATVAEGTGYQFEDLSLDLLTRTARQLTSCRLDDGSRFYVVADELWGEDENGKRRQLQWSGGSRSMFPCGRGFRVWHGKRGRRGLYFDPTRSQVFELDQNFWPVIRRGAWLSRHRPSSRKGLTSIGPWRLFFPETGDYAPLQGLGEDEKLGPLVDDRRLLIWRRDAPGLWLLDPETGERATVGMRADRRTAPIRSVYGMVGTHATAFTPGGTPVVQVSTTGNEFFLGKVVGDELVCTTLLTARQLELLCCPDEDTALVLIDQRSIERLRFDGTTREQLFP